MGLVKFPYRIRQLVANGATCTRRYVLEIEIRMVMMALILGTHICGALSKGGVASEIFRDSCGGAAGGIGSGVDSIAVGGMLDYVGAWGQRVADEQR